MTGVQTCALPIYLIERNQRALPAALLVRMAEQFDFDPRALAAGEPGGGAASIRRRLADPLFADLEIDRHEVEEWLAAAPGGAEAFARAFDRAGGGGEAPADAGRDDAMAAARREIDRWRNHFPDLDAAAEALADDLEAAYTRNQSDAELAALFEQAVAAYQAAMMAATSSSFMNSSASWAMVFWGALMGGPSSRLWGVCQPISGVRRRASDRR